jgi:hypothetical protein
MVTLVSNVGIAALNVCPPRHAGGALMRSDTKVTMRSWRRLSRTGSGAAGHRHRIIVFCAIYNMRWDWLPRYQAG